MNLLICGLQDFWSKTIWPMDIHIYLQLQCLDYKAMVKSFWSTWGVNNQLVNSQLADNPLVDCLFISSQFVNSPLVNCQLVNSQLVKSLMVNKTPFYTLYVKQMSVCQLLFGAKGGELFHLQVMVNIIKCYNIFFDFK